jgi:hypothetical protein
MHTCQRSRERGVNCEMAWCCPLGQSDAGRRTVHFRVHFRVAFTYTVDAGWVRVRC